MRLAWALPLLALAPGAAFAHPSGTAVAWPDAPNNVCTLADQSFRFCWADSNFPVVTTTVTIDWFYTPNMPPTFQLGTTPPDLEGLPIVRGIPEHDRTDCYTWNTSTVATGNYWIFSRVNDNIGEMSLRIIAFSRAPLTIVHPPDPEPPSILLAQPNNPFQIADRRFNLVWEACDPDQTGRITLEAMQRRDGSDAIVLAADLPATRTGTFTWDITNVAEGDWIFRGTIRDGRGLSFYAYSRFLLRIEHLFPVDGGPRVDAAAQSDGGRPDLGMFDGGAGSLEPVEGDSCGCSASGAAPNRGAWLLLLLLALIRARSRGSDPPRGRSRSGSVRPPG